MNKQDDGNPKGSGGRGIEWTDYTWNTVGGCQHGCEWVMPDGAIAECYAKTVAEGVASHSYADGFAHHYYSPLRLDEPLRVKEPARIFLDSMSDLMGAWVPDEQIRAVLDVVRRADWHQFQLLTKNAPRLLKFQDEFPPNLWLGCSLPPSVMFGKPLSLRQQVRMFERIVSVLDRLHRVSVRWMSFEPLSWDVTDYGLPSLDWVVIGAASKGKQYFQPERVWVEHLLDELDAELIPVFFKGNLEWEPRREEFPVIEPPEVEPVQLKMEIE